MTRPKPLELLAAGASQDQNGSRGEVVDGVRGCGASPIVERYLRGSGACDWRGQLRRLDVSRSDAIRRKLPRG